MAERKKNEGKKELALEEAFAQIEKKIALLEDEETSLETAFQGFQEGMALVAHCEKVIDGIEKKVLKLTGEGNLEEFD